MALSKGQKVGILVGGVVLAAGIGFAIYYATKKTTTSGNTPVPTGGTGATSNTPVPPAKAKLGLMEILALIQKIANYTVESFPLKPGMRGPNVTAMQNALRSNFNQLNVSSDGMFGLKTLQALNEIGYVNAGVTSVSRENFNKILEGKYPV